MAWMESAGFGSLSLMAHLVATGSTCWWQSLATILDSDLIPVCLEREFWPTIMLGLAGILSQDHGGVQAQHAKPRVASV